jgi:hypothetical protein
LVSALLYTQETTSVRWSHTSDASNVGPLVAVHLNDRITSPGGSVEFKSHHVVGEEHPKPVTPSCQSEPGSVASKDIVDAAPVAGSDIVNRMPRKKLVGVDRNASHDKPVTHTYLRYKSRPSLVD